MYSMNTVKKQVQIPGSMKWIQYGLLSYITVFLLFSS